MTTTIKKLDVLVIGSGGREHSIILKCLESKICNSVISAPGNGGISKITECFDIDIESNESILDLCRKKSINFVIVGPEVPLSNGIIDKLNSNNILAYGPNKKASQLESSKSFCKNFFKRHNIPTAKFASFNDANDALNYLKVNPAPIVIKASGLAAGKGVIIAKNNDEAQAAIKSILIDKVFGESGNEIIIEECLYGEEVSIHAIVSGDTFLCLSPSQDHKRIGEGDKGLNTGGMGAYAPSSLIDKNLQSIINKDIIIPTINGLKKDNIDFHGTLYAGLMITDSGPKILEYNVRFGDPETQVILPLVKDDFLELLYISAQKKPLPDKINISEKKAIVIVISAKGYPQDYKKNEIINYPKNIPTGTEIIHAGTKPGKNTILSNGGRVLNIVSLDNNITNAAKKAYELCNNISYVSKFYRRDIAHKEIKRELYGK